MSSFFPSRSKREPRASAWGPPSHSLLGGLETNKGRRIIFFSALEIKHPRYPRRPIMFYGRLFQNSSIPYQLKQVGEPTIIHARDAFSDVVASLLSVLMFGCVVKFQLPFDLGPADQSAGSCCISASKSA
jgi:hypothetical protein